MQVRYLIQLQNFQKYSEGLDLYFHFLIDLETQLVFDFVIFFFVLQPNQYFLIENLDLHLKSCKQEE